MSVNLVLNFLSTASKADDQIHPTKKKSRPQNVRMCSAAIPSIDPQNVSSETKNSIHYSNISHDLAHSKIKGKKPENQR